MRSWRKIY